MVRRANALLKSLTPENSAGRNGGHVAMCFRKATYVMRQPHDLTILSDETKKSQVIGAGWIASGWRRTGEAKALNTRKEGDVGSSAQEPPITVGTYLHQILYLHRCSTFQTSTSGLVHIKQ